MPSIRQGHWQYNKSRFCFKPCYKWNAFNTQDDVNFASDIAKVLNLVINGMPSIQRLKSLSFSVGLKVLNLVINGMPSIPKDIQKWNRSSSSSSFKPCYKWNAFNTLGLLPSILLVLWGFKPCYKWNAFNTMTDTWLQMIILKSFKPCYKWNAFNTYHI